MLSAVCPGSKLKINVEFDPLESLKIAASEVDFYGDLASSFMCSPTCPCLNTAEDKKSWTDITESELNTFDRTLI